MPVTPTKPWNVYPNTLVQYTGVRPSTAASRVAQRGNLLRAIKDKFVQMGWTVVRSYGSTTVSNTDKWLTDGLVYGERGGSHSWCVLKPPANMGTSHQLCIEWVSNDGLSYSGAWLYINVAPHGFDLTTGSSTYPPTENIVGGYGQVAWNSRPNNGATWAGSNNDGGRDFYVHGVASADGKQHRVMVCWAGLVGMAFIFEKVERPVPPKTVWSDPVVFTYYSSGYDDRNSTRAFQYARYNDGTTGGDIYTVFDDHVVAPLYLTSEGYGGGTLGENLPYYPNEFTREWELVPAHIYCVSADKKGRIGSMMDLWWGPYHNDGVCYPCADGSRVAQFNHLVMPWTSTDPVLMGAKV